MTDLSELIERVREATAPDRELDCRVCGSRKWVAVWHSAHPEETICIECCEDAEHADGETGHHFDRGDALSASSCTYCGMERL